MKSGINSYKELKPNSITKELVEILESVLPRFKKSQSYKDVLRKKKNERQYSLALCLYMLQETSDSDLFFMNENPQVGNRDTDIGVYKGTVLLFTIEAKRLPTPNGSTRNEYEYVYGNSGGIQRYKNEAHGVDNSDNILPENGMVGFIEGRKFTHWHTKVNEWVIEANWGEEEMLNKNYFDSIGFLKSSHLRKSGSKVVLFHFWIYV